MHKEDPAAEPAFRNHIASEDIAHLPAGGYEGPIRLVYSDSRAAEAVARLSREEVVGFDTETRAVFRKGESHPPALVQLAAADAVYVFRLHQLHDLGGLAPFLSNPAVCKPGVAIDFDIRKLREVRPFEPAGFVELQKLADRAGIRNNGLRALAAIVLGIRISKGAQRTNWSRPRLTDAQIRYAATDAWVCREVFLKLRGHASAQPSPQPDAGQARVAP